jgi:putative heme-binding domain-containing protein
VFGVESVLNQLRHLLTDDRATDTERRDALAILNRVGDDQAVAIYPQLLTHRSLRLSVIPRLGASSNSEVARDLIRMMGDLTAEEKSAALGVLTSRVPFALELLRAVEAGTFDRSQLSALEIRQIHSLGDAQLSELLTKLWGRVHASSDDAREMINRIRKAYTTAPLWAYSQERGQQLYQKTCAVCHPLDGSSVPLGPGLKGSWRNGLDYFLENVVDPNAVVGENYRMTQVVTQSGQTISGLLDSESGSTVVLRTAERTVAIPKSEIEERRLVDQSLMPTGLLDHMSEVEIIELLKFLLHEE